MKRTHLILLILLLFYLLSTASFADDNRRDGNWWHNQTKIVKTTYLVGFFDGMDLGHNFSYWNFINQEEANSCLSRVAESYQKYHDTYFTNVTSGQLAEGLDQFYSDYRNRSILISDAVWLVVNSIAGTPKEKIDSMIENWRRNTK